MSNSKEDQMPDSEIYTYANIFENVKINNYSVNSNFFTILNNYLQNIVPEKISIQDIQHKVKKFSNHIVECLTGNYEIGTGDVDFEELTEYSETISTVIAYSNDEELEAMLNQESNIIEFGEGVATGTVALGLIPSKNVDIANKNFSKINQNIKIFLRNSLKNIADINKKIANAIANISKMDSEESKEFNGNIAGKFLGGLAYEFLSGTLSKKRVFTDVNNSQSMIDKIEEEGILHFTSEKNAKKIIESGKIKCSSFIESDLTKKKSFFFAGTPTFEDLLINIPAYDVMYAVKIKPTQEQMGQLKYRALNDRAVVKDGDFKIEDGQAEIVYYGLMYDKEENKIYLGELTKEEAKNFHVSEEVRNAYYYPEKKSNFLENIKVNAYGFFAEYKHHQKLLQMEEILKERGINFKDVNDNTLLELANIEQTQVLPKSESKNLMDDEKIKDETTRNTEYRPGASEFTNRLLHRYNKDKLYVAVEDRKKIKDNFYHKEIEKEDQGLTK